MIDGYDGNVNAPRKCRRLLTGRLFLEGEELLGWHNGDEHIIASTIVIMISGEPAGEQLSEKELPAHQKICSSLYS